LARHKGGSDKSRKKKKAGSSRGGSAHERRGSSTKLEKEEREKLTPGRRRAVFAAMFFALGVFTALCILSPSSAGIVGRGVRNGLAWLLGIGRFALPVVLFTCAALVFVKKPEVRTGVLAIGILIMAVAILAMLQIPVPPGEMFAASRLTMGGGGGLVGAIIAWPLVKLTGRIGAYVFMFAALFTGLVLAFEEQLIGIWRRFREKRAAPQAVKPVEGEKRTPQKPTAAAEIPASVYPAAPVPAVAVEEEAGGQLAIKVKTTRTGKYKLPPTSLLNQGQVKAFSKKSNEERKKTIEQTLQSMDVDARVVKVSKGPTVSLFEVEVGTGEKVRRVTELEQDIAYALGSPDIRIYSPIPGRQAIGIEVPNHIRDTVLLGDIVDKFEPSASHNLLTVAVGKDMSGSPVLLDLAQLPHLLLAGSTGAGKSCLINALVSCLLFRCRPDQLKFIMIDPKYVEFTWYNGLPHLLCEVINEPEPAAKALLWAVREMDVRYRELQRHRVVHIDDYNILAEKDSEIELMPKVVIVIDELGDLMIVARREVEDSITRLTAKARAVGIHLVLATQRPSVDVITGVIKNNITARIAFQVASNADSRTILGTKGAEKLLGKGDMLFDPGNIPQPLRVQGALIQKKEIELLTSYIREQNADASDGIDLNEVEASVRREIGGLDSLLDEAAEFVVFAGEASASMLQTHLRIGYARARRIVNELADLGIVGPHEGSKARKVLLSPDDIEDWKKRRGADTT